MLLDEKFQIDAPVEATWQRLRDPAFVAGCMPGVVLGEEVEGGYTGQISVKFGPTIAVFAGNAEFEFDDGSRTATIRARGSDKKGTTKAAATVDVGVQPENGRTLVTVSGNIDMVGPLASFASTGGVYVTKALLADFATCVSSAMAPREAGAREMVGTEATSKAPVSVLRIVWGSLVAAFNSLVKALRRSGD